MKHAMELATTDYFSSYSGLNSDISYGEIAGIGALTGVHVAACGLKSFDVYQILGAKIRGLFFIYKKLRTKKTSESNSRYSKYLKLWRMRSFTKEGRTTIFKKLAP